MEEKIKVFIGAISKRVRFILDRYVNNVLASYEEEYTPRILSNHNSDSKYYVMKLGKVVNDKIVPYSYKDKYMCMPKDMDFNLYAIKTNDRLTELFSGKNVAIEYNQPYNFEDVSLEDLENMKNNDCFYVYSLDEISKEKMTEGIHDLMDYHMFRYYSEIFKTESTKQQEVIEKEIELKKNQKVLKEVVDTIGYFAK